MNSPGTLDLASIPERIQTEARFLHGARGTSGRTAISRYVAAEIVAVNECYAIARAVSS